jgi:hypothetical protein
VRPAIGTIIVSTNIREAKFTITGPRELKGEGTFIVFSNVPVGTYTIVYKDVIGYETPQPETKVLTEGAKIEFTGKYNKVLQTSVPNLQEAIKQYTQKKTLVTVGGEQYFIITLKGYIHPVTLQLTEFAPYNPSGEWKLYVDVEGQPIKDEKILQKIFLIDKANHMLHGLHGGSPFEIEERIAGIDNTLKAHEDLMKKEKIDWIAKQVFESSLDILLVIAAPELAASTFLDRISSISKEAIKEDFAPEKVSVAMGIGLLQKAKNEYEKAYKIAANNVEGIMDYETSKEYLTSLYTGYFFEVYGTGLVLPAKILHKNVLATILGWGAEYIIDKTRFHKYREFYEASTLIVKGFTEPTKITVEGIINVLSIASKVEQLLKSSGLPVYYTLALAYRDITKLKEFPLEPYLYEHVSSPVELRVYDAEGKMTGLVNGNIKIEIPNSYYYNNTVIIFFPYNSYTHEVVGMGNGSYSLKLEYFGNRTASLSISEIPISVNVIHRYVIEGNLSAQNITKVDLKIDSDGDGIFEISINLFRSEKISTIMGEEIIPLRIVPIFLITFSVLLVIFVVRRLKKKSR